MSDESDNIEILASDEVKGKSKAAKRFGGPIILGTVFLSSFFGAGAMFLATKLTQKPSIDIAPLNKKITQLTKDTEDLTKTNKALKAQLARLEQSLKTRPTTKPINIVPLEARLKALEAVKPQNIDSALIERLEALKEEGSEALELSDILGRLKVLESRPIVSAPVIISSPENNSLADISDIKAFPKGKVLAALKGSRPSESWLKKSLKKHITVQSDDNPEYLIDLVSENMEAGNLQAAMEAFDKLPAEAKAAAKVWRESLERNP